MAFYHRHVVTFVLGFFLLGCGCQQQPQATLAGGKPVQYWLTMITDPNPKHRKEAAFKLGNVGADEPLALPALIKTLDDSNIAVRKEAILAVIKFGSEAKQAIPSLQKLQNDADVQVRNYAMKALEKIRKS